MKCALAAKNKLGFVNGGITEPEEEAARNTWKRVDEMVCSWIINSMNKGIAETYVYCTSARILRLDLEEQFGRSNGPQVYQIQRHVASIEQGSDLIVMLYYDRMKRLWEELNVLQLVP